MTLDWAPIHAVTTVLTLLFIVYRSAVGSRRRDLKDIGKRIDVQSEKIDVLAEKVHSQNSRIGRLEIRAEVLEQDIDHISRWPRRKKTT